MTSSLAATTAFHKGCFVAKIVSAELKKLTETHVDAAHIRARESRDLKDVDGDGENSFHMTILTAKETKGLGLGSKVTASLEPGTSCDVFPFGVGHGHDCTFLVVGCPYADSLRATIHLPPKDFHITLGLPSPTGDCHDMSKGLTRIRAGDEHPALVANVLWCIAATARLQACAEKNAEVSADLHISVPHDPAVTLMLAKSLANKGCTAEAQAWAQSLLVDGVDAELRAQALYVIAKVKQAACGLGAEEAVAMGTTLIGLRPGSACTGLLRILNGAIVKHPDPLTKTKTVFVVDSDSDSVVTQAELPWNFGASNLEGTVFGCGIVKARHIPALEALGVKAVVNLIGEEPVDAELATAAACSGMTIHHVPMTDRTAPTKAQVHLVLDVLQAASPSGKVVVHCLGGVGRTNTILAAYIMATTTKPPAEAVAWLESRRPVKMTAPQLVFLKTFYAELLETGSEGVGGGEGEGREGRESADHETAWIPTPTSPLPALVVLCGLPGSGKSTFAHQVRRACQDKAVIVSQDDLGREGAETLFVAATKDALRTKQVVVLDKCNVTTESRQSLLQNAPAALRKTAVVVCFPSTTEQCVERMVRRAGNHPVIKGKSAGSCRRIVEDMASKFTAPTLKEGFHTVYGSPEEFWDAHGARKEVTGPRPKFPRTRHLVNLGAMTRDDLLFDAKEVDAFLATDVIVEEKVDGANLGLYLQNGAVMAQHRSNFVDTTSKQYDGLAEWMRVRSTDIHRVLTALGPESNLVLYGEWVAMTHTIHYTALPDRFLVFDVYDVTADKFLSRDVMDVILDDTCFKTARMPVLFSGHTTLSDLKVLAQTARSAFYDGPVEGIYVKTCEDGVVKYRGKIVRADFLGTGEIAHWTSGGMYRKNGIARL